MTDDEIEVQAIKDELRTTVLALKLIHLVGGDDPIGETRQQLAEVDEVLRDLQNG